MAFFEQLGKKLSDAGQGVAKQTKDFAEIARLNSAISDNEKKVARLYADIGKAYYMAHVQDPGAEQRETIEEITATLADIVAKQDAIKQIKGVTKCPSCGAEMPNNATFCSACGYKVSSAESGKVCAKCGASIPAGDRFCSVCGAPAEDTPETPNASDISAAP